MQTTSRPREARSLVHPAVVVTASPVVRVLRRNGATPAQVNAKTQLARGKSTDAGGAGRCGRVRTASCLRSPIARRLPCPAPERARKMRGVGIAELEAVSIALASYEVSRKSIGVPMDPRLT